MATEERDYSHRSAVQKLGVKPAQRVEITGDVGSGLRRDVKEAVGRGLVRSGELDGAIVLVESEDEGREALVRYRHAVSLNPDLVTGWRGVAAAASALGDRGAMVDALNALERLQPDSDVLPDIRAWLEANPPPQQR